MGKMGRATCMICGREFPIEQMEMTFIGRARFRCYECIENGDKQVIARLGEAYIHGRGKRLKELDEWK